MAQALRTSAMTRDAFLQWAEGQEERFEFDGLVPVGMGGSTLNHTRIAQNLWRSIDRQLAGTPCEAFVGDGGVATAGDAVRFPDVTVTCSPAVGRDRLVPEPVLVFEVQSPPTGGTDRIVKLEEYRSVPSISTYVILEQDSAALLVFRRQADGQWSASALTAGQELVVDAPALRVPLTDIYARVDFPA